MSLAVSRIGDMAIGICSYITPHVIVCTAVVGSPLTSADGLSILRIGDLCSTTCPGHNPIAFLITGSALTTDLGIGVSRISDGLTHSYGTATMIGGSAIVTSA